MSHTYFRLADAPWPVQAASAANLPTAGHTHSLDLISTPTIFWAWPNVIASDSQTVDRHGRSVC